MNSLLEQVKLAATSASEAERKVILNKLRDVADSIESKEDTMQRIFYYGLKISGIRIGCDLDIFSLLSSNGAMNIDQLASKNGADPILLGRICRYLASINMIKETGKDTFSATNITETLSDPAAQAGVYFHFDTVGPQWQALPDFLAETKYKNVTDNTNTALHRAFSDAGPGTTGFSWMLNHPVAFGHFNTMMATRKIDMPTWLDVYPVEKEAESLNADENTAMIVDVGGGFGHQCNALKTKYPGLKGRIILQDLPPALEHAKLEPGIEAMVHNFFEPQPIKGAKYYYMRNILHDYPDDKCVDILHNLKDAMSGHPESVILIDEMVLPNEKVHWHATQLDLTMMCALASMERTIQQWHALLKLAGLKVERIYEYIPSVHDSILVAVPI